MSIASDCGLTELEYAASQYSDVHKDAYGFRPRGNHAGWTLEDYDRELARLYVVCERRREEEVAYHRASIAAFETRIGKLIACGAGDRETAVRWLQDACYGDIEAVCDYNGLPYGYLNRSQAA